MVSHLNSFRYIEMDEEFIETPFQHFEEVPQTLASAKTVVEDPPMKMASLKDARAVIKKGECTNWGQITIERMHEPAHCHEINTEEVVIHFNIPIHPTNIHGFRK